ncbi:33540_t:CDS:2, partial [Racocetra persica]
LDLVNVNKDGPGNAKRENSNGSQRKDSISLPSKKNLGPATLLSIARTSKKLQSFSNFTKHCLNTPTISSFIQTTQIQTSTSSITTTNNNKSSINPNSNLTTSTNNSALITSTDKLHQSSTVVTSSRAKQCFQCGEKTTNRINTNNNSDQLQSSSKLLCGDCGDLLNSFLFPSKNINFQNFCVDKNTITSNRINHHTTTIVTGSIEYNIQKCIKSGNKDNEVLQMAIFENEYYWNHYLEKKRKSPARLWGNTNNPEGRVEVLDGLIPLNKRARWLNRSNYM